MLTEADEQLLTAAVDGELSPDRRPAFVELVARSPAAARLYASLLADRDRLASLPRPPAPVSLWADLFARIQPVTPAAGRAPRRTNWTPAAMAASFLLAVAAGTYWLAASQQPQPTVAKQLQQLPKDDSAFAPQPGRPAAAVEPEPAYAALPATLPPTAVETVRGGESPAAAPATASSDQFLTARPVTAAKPFDRVDVKLPLLLTAADLARGDAQTSLRDQIARNPATRIDLFVRDTAHTADIVATAGRAVNLNVLVETIAGERMKRKMPSTWLVYADSLTPAEIVKWLTDAAAADTKAASGSGGLFSSLHVVGVAAPEQKDVQSLLGIDIGLGKKPADANAHISSKTLDQVTSAIQKGQASRSAILLTYLPTLGRVHPALSKDVRQFHELRKDRKPGTAAVLLVIRPAN